MRTRGQVLFLFWDIVSSFLSLNDRTSDSAQDSLTNEYYAK